MGVGLHCGSSIGYEYGRVLTLTLTHAVPPVPALADEVAAGERCGWCACRAPRAVRAVGHGQAAAPVHLLGGPRTPHRLGAAQLRADRAAHPLGCAAPLLLPLFLPPCSHTLSQRLSTHLTLPLWLASASRRKGRDFDSAGGRLRARGNALQRTSRCMSYSY